ncbi:uncharacterized protein LOC113467929 [Diaphorina citri]|uniref:Uncharacterized protein LOC113467929 n=1 Tax=Diaphorina citri TaxID=121845 RepID=A0A3Q0J0K3_DIACI|nr:uncharacterized protein LOC113467929 [Diaphorina citri]
MMSQTKEDFFRNIQVYLQDKDKDSKFPQLSRPEQLYIRTHSTVSHSDQRPVDDYLHTAHVAVFLYQLLKSSNYFKSNDAKLEELIGGSLRMMSQTKEDFFRNIQVYLQDKITNASNAPEN